MSNRLEIRDHDGVLLAYKLSAPFPEGLSAYSEDDDFVQVLSWNYAAGKRLQAHKHLHVSRAITHTQEVAVVMSGRMVAEVFDLQDRLVQRVPVGAGECLVLLRGGHGYEILDDETRVLEIKNGPYPGADRDRLRLPQ